MIYNYVIYRLPPSINLKIRSRGKAEADSIQFVGRKEREKERDFQFPSHYLNFDRSSTDPRWIWIERSTIRPPIISLMTKWGGRGEGRQTRGREFGRCLALFPTNYAIWSYPWKRLPSPVSLFACLPISCDYRLAVCKINSTEIRASVSSNL